MLASVLFGAASASINADLVPPFVPSAGRQIGVWDFAGTSIILPDRIVLTPPMQYHQGSAWSTVKLPHTNWSMQIELEISDGTGGGNFAIWLVSNRTRAVAGEVAAIVLFGAVR
jgi:hypothetical protein